MNLTIKDVPKALHARLRSVAEENGRSLNKQVVATLEAAVMPRRHERRALLEGIRRRRAGMKLRVTMRGIDAATNEARR